MCEPFKRQSSDARVPLRAYPTSAGYDLYAAESESLKPREWALIKLQLSFAIPIGFYGKIVGCSGLADVQGIVAFNGTADADYRGTVCVVLFNLSDNEYIVEIGNGIAQLIIEKCYDVKFVEYNELPDTQRFIFRFLENMYSFHSRASFRKSFYAIKSTADLHYRLLNTLNLIFYNGYLYCFCNEYAGPRGDVQMNSLPFVHCVKYKFRLKTLLSFWIEINSIPHVWVNISFNCLIIWTNVFFLIKKF